MRFPALFLSLFLLMACMPVSAAPHASSPTLASALTIKPSPPLPIPAYPSDVNLTPWQSTKGLPSVITGLVATGDIEKFHLTWKAPAQVGPGIDEYYIKAVPGDFSTSVPSDVTSTDIKIAAGKYVVSVYAENMFGASLEVSTTVEVASPPPPPTPAYIAPVYVAPAAPSGGTHIISGVTYYRQVHNLSCEEAATQMALTHQGIYLSQDQILNEMGADLRPPVRDATGFHWGDPYVSFVGNVNGHANNFTGYQANPPPLVAVATRHGAKVIESGDGISAAEVYKQVALDHPTVVYATWDWAWHPRNDYIAFDGRRVPYIGPLDAHVYTVVGISPTQVLVNDPLRGQYWVSRSSFETSFSEFNQAIVFA